MQPALMIIIPAHNEALHISKTLQSLKPLHAEIAVIADNCTDATAQVSAACGARVIIRNDSEKSGKPHALAYALNILMPEGYRYYAFVDADTEVEANFADVLVSHFEKGADAVQVRYAQKTANISLQQRLMDIAFFASNTVRPLGRSYWGVSCGIFGNGFAVTRETLLTVPLQVDSVVEDLAYHIKLVASGRKVTFSTQSTVWAAMPADKHAASTQRSRWEGGRLKMLKSQAPALIKLVCRGRFELLEPLLDLLFPPIAFYTTACLLLLVLPLPIAQVYALIALSSVLLYCLTTVAMRQEIVKDCAALCLAPIYLLWKLSMLPRIIKSAKNAVWQRTERDKEHK